MEKSWQLFSEIIFYVLFILLIYKITKFPCFFHSSH
nr:MAG TPA: hypothetical protein [Caudoviricetes sp.]